MASCVRSRLSRNTRSSFLMWILPITLMIFAPLRGNAAQPQAVPETSADRLAQDAFAVLEKRCGECHGNRAQSRGGFFFRDYTGLVNTITGKVKPKDPEHSRIMVRVLDTGDPMPPADARDPTLLNETEKKTLRDWILVGAPQPTSGTGSAAPSGTVIPPRTRITEADILSAILSDLTQTNERDRIYYRYFTLTHLYNNGSSPGEIKAYELGLSKLINSLSWKRRIVRPTPIDPAQTVFRIDMRDYAWEEKTWKALLSYYPYGVRLSTSGAQRIYAATRCELPYVRADWFVARAAVPPLYHELLDLPMNADDLERSLKVDRKKDIQEETACRAGFSESGVSRNNRVVERHESAYGAYWRSYDFSANSGKQNIFKNPLAFEEAGGEIIFNLPNGLQGYMLVNGRGERINDGPIAIVNNKQNSQDPVVHNGLTCMSCHARGMKRFEDGMRTVLLATPRESATFDYDKALALYKNRATMDAFLATDSEVFAKAVQATGSEVADKEPIVALQARYEGSVTAAEAAAELCLPEEAFQAGLKQDTRLGTLLTVLHTPGGVMKRDAWEEYFGDAVTSLKLGEFTRIATGASAENTAPTVAHDALPSETVTPSEAVFRASTTGTVTRILTRRNPRDGAEMVFIPAGPFPMGDSDRDNNPRHTVYVSGYWIYRNLVTVAMYYKFCQATGRAMPPAPKWDWRADHPIVNVTWDDACAYCAWAGVRLPTEAEWEKAARGTDARMFPWGNDWDPRRLHSSKASRNDAGSTAPAGSYPSGASPYGLLDMAGNVWQWCLDWYDDDYWRSGRAGRPDPLNDISARAPGGGTPARVQRGGSWGENTSFFYRCVNRGWYDPGRRADWAGFRCVAPPAP